MITTRGAGVLPVTPKRTTDLKRELFLLTAVGLAEGLDYYTDTDERFVDLIGHLALADDGWLARFIGWLRSRDDLASAAVIAATEMVRVRLGAGLTTSGGNRKVISDALKRADEPGALLDYWFRHYGRTMPKPIKHGLADATQNLYDERALATYDTIAARIRFAGVINFVHPRAITGDQRELFGYAIARRRPNAAIPASLPLLRARELLYSLTPAQRREILGRPHLADRFAEASLTWDLLDGWLLGETDSRAWEAVLPSMGYADRLTRLHELDVCGLSRETVRRLNEELADPARITRERILPLRLYEAGRQTQSRTWASAMDRAMQATLTNVPSLPGQTLILIDRSASMFTQVARGSAVTLADRATVFGTALALRAEEANLVQFGTSHRRVEFTADDPLPAVLQRFWQLGDGNAADAVSARFRGHDRVVIITDEPDGSAWQGPHPAADLPHRTPCYIWNVASTAREFSAGRGGSGWRHVFSGLTDAAFDVIPLIEAAHHDEWPF
jgi:hypothetical protein